MYDAYTRIFTRMGLKFRAVQADGGSIGGNVSQEFHVLADSGEDAIAFSTAGDYAANLETATTLAAAGARARAVAGAAQGRDAGRAHHRRAQRVSQACPRKQCVKTLLVDGSDGDVVAMVLRGDHELNAVKAQKLAGVANPLRMASAERVREADRTATRARSVRSDFAARSTSTTPRRSSPISSAAPTRRTCTSPA